MADATNFIITRKHPWLLTFLGLITIAALVGMPVLVEKSSSVEIPDIAKFIGHFHPVLLHLPIGVFILILFQETGAIFSRRDRELARTSLFPLGFGAASSVAAVITGFLLFHGHADEYGGNALAERHLWGGLAFAVAAVLTYMIKAWTVALAANSAWYRLLLFISVGVMSFASHDGAAITHGSDYLTRYAPASLKKILGLNTEKSTRAAAVVNAEPIIYQDVIAPILERRCVSCHNPEKPKGKLRMDTYDLLLVGGKSGPAMVPGDSGKSEIVIRIELPEDDDEHMPPEGKPDIEDHELLVLKWWIDNGAKPDKTLKEMNPPAEVKAALAKLPSAK